MEKMNFEIYRCSPNVDTKPHMRHCELELEPADIRLLNALVRPKAQDDTLSFRHSCREGICDSGGMNINDENDLVCLTDLCDLRQSIKIRPLSGLPVIRDSIVDMTQFFKQYHPIKPYIVNGNPIDANKERLRAQEEHKELDGLYECILYAYCSTACPSFWWSPDKFVGPLSLLSAYCFIADNRNITTNKRLDNLNDSYRPSRCHTIMNCVGVCPKYSNPARAIGKIKETILKRAAWEMVVFDNIAKREIRFRVRRELSKLDLIFDRFMEKKFEYLSGDELICLVEVLAFQDQELLSLINDSHTTDRAHLVLMLEKIGRSWSNRHLRRQWRPPGNKNDGWSGCCFCRGVV